MLLTTSLSTGVTSTAGTTGAADVSTADARLSMRFSAEEKAGSTTASTFTALVAVDDVLAREFLADVNAEIRRSMTPSESWLDGVLVLLLSVVAFAALIGQARAKIHVSKARRTVFVFVPVGRA